MKKSGKVVQYVDSNNYLENTNTVLEKNTVIPQFIDPIRFLSKNMWTTNKRKLEKISTNGTDTIFEVEKVRDNVLLLKANKKKFEKEFFENGIYRKEFNETAKDEWIQYARNIIPPPTVVFEDTNLIFSEPVNIPELNSDQPPNTNYINKEFVYKFFSFKYENLVTNTIFDTTILPSPYNLVFDTSISPSNEEKNLVLGLGGFIPSGLVDRLFYSNETTDALKEYFDYYADAVQRPEAVSVINEIKNYNQSIYVTKNVTTLSNKFKKSYTPFPYYSYAEFSNISSKKEDLVHVLDGFGGLQNDLLVYIDQIRVNSLTKNFIYNNNFSSEKGLEFFSLSSWLGFELPILLDQDVINPQLAIDALPSIEKVVNYTNLINYMNKFVKNTIRDYDKFMTDSCDYQVLIYKVEKRLFSHDAAIIQNYYIIPDESEIIRFFDTQIKYGAEYYYTLSAYTLVIGNKYSYEPYEYASQIEYLSDRDNGFFKIKYNNTTNYKIFTIPLAKWSGAIVETPYTKPVVNTMENNGLLRITLEQSDLENYEKFEILENEEFQIFNLIKKSQDNNDKETIKSVRNDRSVKKLQIYRTTNVPTNFLSFQGKLYKTVILENNQNSFLDNLLPNVKYYYLFRYLNEHDIPSNTSDLFELCLKNEDDYVYLESKKINLRQKYKKTDSKQMKKYILVRPSIIQTQPNYPENVISAEEIEFGPSNSVWEKDFTMNITSRKTNKILQFSLKNTLDKKK